MESLTRLFGSPIRLKLLRLFFFNQDTAFTIEVISERTKAPKEELRTELTELLASGVIRKKTTKGESRFTVDPKYIYFSALEVFIRETTSVRPQDILMALKKAGTLKLVVLSGHFVGLLEPQADLLVVGDALNERALARAVSSLEADLGREIRYTNFTTSDFRYRIGVYDRLLRDVFDYEHRVLLDKIGLK